MTTSQLPRFQVDSTEKMPDLLLVLATGCWLLAAGCLCLVRSAIAAAATAVLLGMAARST